MKKPFKIPFIVLSIVSAALFVGVVVMTFVNLLGQSIFEVTKQIFELGFIDVIFKSGEASLLAFFIAGCVLALAAIVLLIVSIIFIKRAGPKAIGIILSVLALVPAALLAITGGMLFESMKLYFDARETGKGIVVIVFFVVALAQIICTILAVIFGIKFSRVNASKYSEIAQSSGEPVGEALAAPVVDSEYEEAEVEPVPVFTPEPEPQPEPEPEKEPEPVEEEKKEEPKELSALDLAGLTALLKEAVRDIVRDEIARNNANQEKPQPVADSHTDNHSVVGATFGGPLVVQYFNGGINGVTPAAPQVVEAPAPAPTPAPAPVEEKKEEPKPEPVEEKVEEPVVLVVEEPKVEEPAPVPAPVAEPVKEEKPVEPKAPIIRIPFEERLIGAEKEMQENYNELKNEILSWGVKSRVSNSGDTFRLHRKTYIKLTIAGKSLKLYFALNPDDYRDSTIPVQDAGGKNIYQEIPLVFKVKSPLSMRRCKQLIQDVMEKDGLEQGEVGSVNWVKELKAEMKAREKAEKK